MIVKVNKVGTSVKVTRPSVVVAVLSNSSIQSTSNNSTTIYRRYHIQTNSIVWIIPHNLNTDKFTCVLRDEQGNQFSALIRNVDQKKFEVHLSEATTGFVDVIFDTSTVSTIIL